MEDNEKTCHSQSLWTFKTFIEFVFFELGKKTFNFITFS